MYNLSEGSSFGTIPSCGEGEGFLRSGGAGIGDGGSISNGILLINLLHLHERLG
jgi:hypothetical protein